MVICRCLFDGDNLSMCSTITGGDLMKVGDLVKIKDNQLNSFGVSIGIVVKLATKQPDDFSLPAVLVCWTLEGYEHW